MKTIEERAQEFQLEYNDLCQKYGMTWQAVCQARQLGDVIQVEPQLGLAEIADWQPPQPLNGNKAKVKPKEGA